VRAFAVCVAALALAGCGDARAPQARVSGREWRSNTSIVVRQLQADIAATQITGGTPAAARASLRDDSSLYGLLVSYSDFAGCSEMVASAGPTPPAAEHIVHSLVAGCRHLERASTLFTAAVKTDDGASLLAARREAGLALAPLVDAAAGLKSAR
jgi:hypothetical protein